MKLTAGSLSPDQTHHWSSSEQNIWDKVCYPVMNTFTKVLKQLPNWMQKRIWWVILNSELWTPWIGRSDLIVSVHFHCIIWYGDVIMLESLLKLKPEVLYLKKKSKCQNHSLAVSTHASDNLSSGDFLILLPPLLPIILSAFCSVSSIKMAKQATGKILNQPIKVFQISWKLQTGV